MRGNFVALVLKNANKVVAKEDYLMEKHIRNRAVSIFAGCCLSVQVMLAYGALPMYAGSANALADVRGASAASIGSSDECAYIRGNIVSIDSDSELKSDVLHIGGDSFGSGWLQLPSLFDGVKDGFTLSMKYKLESDAENYTRLFQFSSLPFGTGSAPSYSSPDISVDLKDGTSFRGSVFAGKSERTENDGKHSSLFNITEKPDSGKWHDFCAVYTADSAEFYIDGKIIPLENDETLSDTMASLFGEGLLSSYTYNAIGHSLYSDHDLRAAVDDVAFYDYALTAAQVTDLPDNAKFLYTFEEDTITPAPEGGASETNVSLGGAQLESIPVLQTSSPDNTLTAKIWKDSSGSFYYSVDKLSGGRTSTVIQPSKLGFVTGDEDLSVGLTVQEDSLSRSECDETYSMPNGKHCEIRNNYNEISFPLVKKDSVMTVTFRIYDDGIGFRYALNHGASIKEEKSEIVFPEKGTFWGNWPNATYEWEIAEYSMDKIKSSYSDYSVPFMGNVDSKFWVLVSEANVFNEQNPYCAGSLHTVGGSRALLWKPGIKVDGLSMGSSFHTPWRAVVIADNLSDMSSSDLILNLNPPSVLEDTSWIKPGKVAWSWWSSGGDSPIEYHTQKDYIDFAAENGWDYVCLDFGWALWDNSADKVRELCEYGAKKGIGIFLWYGVNNSNHSGYRDSAGHPAYPYYSLLDKETIVREFERISSLGVKGVKVDYYESDTQKTMDQMRMCAEYAMENKLMVLFHGCTMPRGESRTYPNVISYEAVNGTEYYKWGSNPSLANRITYTFLRNTVGSADFTPTGVPIQGVRATAGFALSDVVNIESGVQHFAQSVYTYEGNAALPFLNDVPVKWDDMCVVDGYPMQFNVTARRSGSDWYVGASTINKRTVEIPLAKFIDDDGEYTAYIFGDNANGTKIEVTVLPGLTEDSVIKRDLLQNGGFAMKLTKTAMKLTTKYSAYDFYEAEDAVLSGEAAISSGKYCSNNSYVGYVGKRGNDVTFNNVNVDRAGEYTLRIYYISGETRSLQVGVNGSQAAKLDGLFANKNDWSGICAVNTKVGLKQGANTIRLYNDSAYAPSIDRIAIVRSDEEILAGDLDFDGVIDSIDTALLRSVIADGTTDSRMKSAADFDGNGKIDGNDLKSHTRFVLGN